MKRTFGKILSFALVLAMVLAMVPAVLAATNGVYQGDAIQVAPREEGTITYTRPENTTYYTYADHITYFVSSNPDAVTVSRTERDKATVKVKAASGSVTIYGYEKQEEWVFLQ